MELQTQGICVEQTSKALNIQHFFQYTIFFLILHALHMYVCVYLIEALVGQ